MSEMMKRAATALKDAHLHRLVGYEGQARAVIAAIREPTEAMIAAGWIDKEDVSPKEIFTAMIDEALR